MDVVSVLQRKGGVGKSTLIVHVAIAALRAGLNVVIIDLDPQKSADEWGKLRLHNGEDQPVVLAATPGQLLEKLRTAADHGADLVLIDTAPHAESPALEAAKAADFILVPTRPAFFDMKALGATAQIVRLARKPAAVVLNAVPPRNTIVSEAAAATQEFGLELCPIYLHHRIDYSHALNSGSAVQEFNPNGKAAGEIKDFWIWLRTQLGHSAKAATKRSA